MSVLLDLSLVNIKFVFTTIWLIEYREWRLLFSGSLKFNFDYALINSIIINHNLRVQVVLLFFLSVSVPIKHKIYGELHSKIFEALLIVNFFVLARTNFSSIYNHYLAGKNTVFFIVSIIAIILIFTFIGLQINPRISNYLYLADLQRMYLMVY